MGKKAIAMMTGKASAGDVPAIAPPVAKISADDRAALLQEFEDLQRKIRSGVDLDPDEAAAKLLALHEKITEKESQAAAAASETTPQEQDLRKLAEREQAKELNEQLNKRLTDEQRFVLKEAIEDHARAALAFALIDPAAAAEYLYEATAMLRTMVSSAAPAEPSAAPAEPSAAPAEPSAAPAEPSRGELGRV